MDRGSGGTTEVGHSSLEAFMGASMAVAFQLRH